MEVEVEIFGMFAQTGNRGSCETGHHAPFHVKVEGQFTVGMTKGIFPRKFNRDWILGDFEAASRRRSSFPVLKHQIRLNETTTASTSFYGQRSRLAYCVGSRGSQDGHKDATEASTERCGREVS